MTRQFQLSLSSRLAVSFSRISAATEDNMRSFFDKFGELSFVQLKKKADGSSRGYGFIRYAEMADQVWVTVRRGRVREIASFCGQAQSPFEDLS